ncbi:MAG: hypothetical protein U1E43_07990 [Rhodospirillales bacterium]
MAGPPPEQHAQILAQKLADGQLALFVGAGPSRQAIAKDGSGRKLPLWIDPATQVAAACSEDLATYSGNVLDLFDAIVFGAKPLRAGGSRSPGDRRRRARALGGTSRRWRRCRGRASIPPTTMACSAGC